MPEKKFFCFLPVKTEGIYYNNCKNGVSSFPHFHFLTIFHYSLGKII